MDRFVINQKCYFSNPLSELQKQTLDDTVIDEPSENFETRSSYNQIVIIQSLHSKTIIENFQDKRGHTKSWRDNFTWL
ncbi:unnamed protein product [Paramecium primaurelia]|uniref:Uncharacterized protein n=2 Tax=Paramecium TaxID=5884 RepID=A0A8S1UDY7_9CILI|nr:unnamed protein product [Paramecium primaurelia]CAD8163118.1 unnamed protein product [Paramecium pentaurelia]